MFQNVCSIMVYYLFASVFVFRRGRKFNMITNFVKSFLLTGPRRDLWGHGPAAHSVTRKRELLVTTIYTEPLHHGMVEVGKRVKRSSSPYLCSEQGHLQLNRLLRAPSNLTLTVSWGEAFTLFQFKVITPLVPSSQFLFKEYSVCKVFFISN